MKIIIDMYEKWVAQLWLHERQTLIASYIIRQRYFSTFESVTRLWDHIENRLLKILK